MGKITAAYEKIAQFLSLNDGEWTVDGIWREIGNFDDMLPHHIRRAAKLLPAGCLTKRGGKLIFSARHFAKPDEIIAALKSLPHWDDDLPVLIERHYPVLREKLVLANDWALSQSLEWAAPREHFIIDYSFYGQSVRMAR